MNPGYEFEREQGGIHGKAWREERKGRNDVIIITKIKEKTLKILVTTFSLSE